MNASARNALRRKLLSNGTPEAAIPRHVTPLMRACLLKMLRAGGLERAEERKSYGGHVHRRMRWCARGTCDPVGDLAVNGLIGRGLAIALVENERKCKARLTLMGHWFAETLEAQGQRGEVA